ncbi:MAG: Crp/Fnr family transcriptional regulator [Oscillospiraceae bacterium]|nr:Crp/Fnr family transcriptional regulator [Oscillospiraceae bacterium]
MEQYFSLLLQCALFDGIAKTELAAMLSCLGGKVHTYPAASTILQAGAAVRDIGIVLSGRVQVIKEDYFGNSNLLTELNAPEIFAETFACAAIQESPVTVHSVTGCAILWINYRKIITPCSSACGFHAVLIGNMLRIVAGKNLLLNQKIEFLSMRTMQEKLMAYFTLQRQKSGSDSFAIPFSRQELADFLCVDRSALSRTLCKMRDDGLLRFKGNQFTLLP